MIYNPYQIIMMKLRRMSWKGCTVCSVSARKPEGKRPLARPKHKLEDNIKIDYEAIEIGASNGLMWLGIGGTGGLL
jgi:hypothetical protein